jgi:hypothetical protein
MHRIKKKNSTQARYAGNLNIQEADAAGPWIQTQAGHHSDF